MTPDVFQPEIVQKIHDLVATCGVDPNSFEADLITQQIQTSLRLLFEGHDTGQIKLITKSLKEMRYAYRIFNNYRDVQCVSIFGSARTPEDHPDYIAAKNFSSKMATLGWHCMTGAANGIMKAGLEGAKKEARFGLSIRLPFESAPVGSMSEGDPNLIIFRYFFTRKLMFVSHSDAFAAFPGGYGTLDELFEVLTLMQTGKTSILPIVLMEGDSGKYWLEWQQYVKEHLEDNRWVSPEDKSLYFIAPSVDAAVAHIQTFYKCYHSSRYVNDILVIRLKTSLPQERIEALSAKFSKAIASGTMYATGPLPEEKDALELPRIAFHHTRRDFALIRLIIDEINSG